MVIESSHSEVSTLGDPSEWPRSRRRKGTCRPGVVYRVRFVILSSPPRLRLPIHDDDDDDDDERNTFEAVVSIIHSDLISKRAPSGMLLS